MPLTYSIQEAMEWKQEQEALRGTLPNRSNPQLDINFSRQTGIGAMDVLTFREYSKKGVLIIVRCPKITARGWHGLLPPKPLSVKTKTGQSGVVVTKKGRMFVSDYDLMSIWRRGEGGKWRKIVVTAGKGVARGPYPAEGRMIVKALNAKLVSRIQHGCQDDFASTGNPGVKMSDHFAAFFNGQTEYLSSSRTCQAFYKRMGLGWPYNEVGRYVFGFEKTFL